MTEAKQPSEDKAPSRDERPDSLRIRHERFVWDGEGGTVTLPKGKPKTKPKAATSADERK